MTFDSFIDSLKNDPQSLIERFNSYSQRRYHNSPETIEIIRKASTGRPKSAEELAKISAASRKNNGFRDEHHTVESIRKMNATKMRNGILGRFPQKEVTLLRIAKELNDAGEVDKVKIAALAMKQMRKNGIKISRVHAYRILPQQYKNPQRVVACRNSKIRK